MLQNFYSGTHGTKTPLSKGLQSRIKEIYEILMKNYNAYEAFNKRFKKFRKDFSKLPTMNLQTLKNDYIINL